KLGLREIEHVLTSRRERGQKRTDKITGLLAGGVALLATSFQVRAQSISEEPALQREGGIIITMILVMIPILTGLLLMAAKITGYSRRLHNKKAFKDAEQLLELTDAQPEIIENLETRRNQLRYTLSRSELSGQLPAEDKKG